MCSWKAGAPWPHAATHGAQAGAIKAGHRPCGSGVCSGVCTEGFWTAGSVRVGNGGGAPIPPLRSHLAAARSGVARSWGGGGGRTGRWHRRRVSRCQTHAPSGDRPGFNPSAPTVRSLTRMLVRPIHAADAAPDHCSQTQPARNRWSVSILAVAFQGAATGAATGGAAGFTQAAPARAACQRSGL
jgi:hypothetical protein